MPDSESPFASGTVVRVPFPYTDAETRQHRPALVVAAAGPGAEPMLLWVVMITSSENRGWAGDVAIPDAAAAGLPAPSLIRTAKLATIDLPLAEQRGRVEPATLAAVREQIARRLAFSPPAGTDS